MRTINDMQDDETKPEVFSKTLMSMLKMLGTLPRSAREELLHHVTCSLAKSNRMYAQAYFDDASAFATLRENGFEPTIACAFGEDDGLPPTVCVDIHGVSVLRDVEFLRWLSDLLAPFGGHVGEAGYADPPGPDAKRPTDH